MKKSEIEDLIDSGKEGVPLTYRKGYVECAFCGIGYLAEETSRPADCAFCLGQKDRAEALDKYLDEQLDTLTKVGDGVRMRELASKLVGSYYQFELRVRARRLGF